MNIYSNINQISQELLHELFSYSDGELFWKVSPKAFITVGDIAGCVEVRGYKVIKILGRKYKAHRLIFLYHNGYIPKFIDHIDGNRINNRIENLRVATREQNNQNAKFRKDNTSGIKGVSWNKRTKKWIAQCSVNGVSWFRSFDDFDEACKSIKQYREKHHKEFTNHGII